MHEVFKGEGEPEKMKLQKWTGKFLKKANRTSEVEKNTIV